MPNRSVSNRVLPTSLNRPKPLSDGRVVSPQEALVDEDGCYMSAAGPELHRRPVLTEGDQRVLRLLGTFTEGYRGLLGTCAEGYRGLRGPCTEGYRGLLGMCIEGYLGLRGTCTEGYLGLGLLVTCTEKYLESEMTIVVDAPLNPK